jgi:hypothetical protein
MPFVACVRLKLEELDNMAEEKKSGRGIGSLFLY